MTAMETFRHYLDPIIFPDDKFLFTKANILTDFTHVVPITGILLYVIAIFGLPKILPAKGFRKEVKYISALHNLFLAVLSMVMFYVVGGDVLKYALRDGLAVTVCDAAKVLEDTPSLALYMTYLFILSKYVELFDTVLLVLKNPTRKINFLHWYHHITVLAVSWYATYYRLSAGFQFTVFNTFVHSIMYSYYFIVELFGTKVLPGFIAPTITAIQIIQMIYGIWVNYTFVVMWSSGIKCNCQSTNLIYATVLMYASYLALFVKFAWDRYGAPLLQSKPKAGGKPVSKKDD